MFESHAFERPSRHSGRGGAPCGPPAAPSLQRWRPRTQARAGRAWLRQPCMPSCASLANDRKHVDVTFCNVAPLLSAPSSVRPPRAASRAMSALFDFRSFLTILLLSICSCTYVKMRAPQVRSFPPLLLRLSTLTRTRSRLQLLDPYRTGPRGVLWKLARCVRQVRLAAPLSLRSRSPPRSASVKG